MKKNQTEKRYSFAADTWRRLCKSKLAMLGVFILVVLVVCAVFADFIAPYAMDAQNLNGAYQLPTAAHWFGTDEYGRDIFSRCIFGARISLVVGFIAVGIASTPSYARIVRASVLSVKDQEYIEAARAIGTSDFKIIVKHVLPNCLAPIIVQATAGVALAILTAAGLSFLGLGIQPPTPEWGSMLSSGRHYIRDNWNMTVFPGLCIAATIFSLNVLGDGLRDALDPKLRD